MSDAAPEHTGRLHSELGASICDRWWNCPGSVNLTRGMPNTESDAAQRGTAAHEIAELCWTGDQDAIEYVGRVVNGVEIDERIADAVQHFLDDNRSIIPEIALKSSVLVEFQFDLSSLNPPAPMFGTADWCVYVPIWRKLYVRDYKNGYKFVDAVGNRQMRYYALGAVLALGDGKPVREVEVTICQPNAIGRDPIRRETFDAVELAEWGMELMSRARATVPADAPLSAGTWCKFCPAAGRCPEQARHSFETACVEMPAIDDASPIGDGASPIQTLPLARVPAIDDASPIQTLPLALLTPEQLGIILSRLAVLETFVKDARALATDELRAGRSVPGWKLVPNRPSSRWINEAEAADTLLLFHDLPDAERFAPQEVVSPAVARGHITARILASKQADYALGRIKRPLKKDAEAEAKSRLADMIRTESTGTNLAPDTDDRLGLPAPGSEFTSLPD